MSRTAREIGALRRQALHLQERFLCLRGGRGDADVRFRGEHVADDFGRVGGVALDPQPRVRDGHAGDRGGHHALGEVRAGTHRKRTRLEPGEQLDLAAHLGLALEHDGAAFEQHAAEHRGRRALVRALEQPDAEVALQRGDAARQRRLRETERLGGTREIAPLSEHQRVAEETILDHA